MVAHVHVNALAQVLDDLERDLMYFPARVEDQLRQFLIQTDLDDELRCRALILLGGTLYFQGQYEEMISTVQTALRDAHRLDLKELEGRALNGLGVAAREQGRLRDAFDYFRQSLTLCRTQGDALGAARALCNVAQVYRILQRPDQALDLLLEAQELVLRVSHPHYTFTISSMLAWTFLDLGRVQQALAVVNLFLSLAEQEGNDRYVVNLTCARAMVFKQLGLLPQALASAQKAVAWVTGQSALDRDGESFRVLGQVQSELGDYENADLNLNLALERAERSGQVFERVLVVTALLELYQRIGAVEKARQLAECTVSPFDPVQVQGLSLGSISHA